jgi:hypothetical protein
MQSLLTRRSATRILQSTPGDQLKLNLLRELRLPPGVEVFRLFSGPRDDPSRQHDRQRVEVERVWIQLNPPLSARRHLNGDAVVPATARDIAQLKCVGTQATRLARARGNQGGRQRQRQAVAQLQQSRVGAEVLGSIQSAVAASTRNVSIHCAWSGSNSATKLSGSARLPGYSVSSEPFQKSGV